VNDANRLKRFVIPQNLLFSLPHTALQILLGWRDIEGSV
jgi:hypothetical protein